MKRTAKRELAAALQPVEIGTDLDPVGLKPSIRSTDLGQDFGSSGAVISSEVSGDGDRAAAVDVIGELVDPIGGVGKELANAQQGVEWAARFVNLRRRSNE